MRKEVITEIRCKSWNLKIVVDEEDWYDEANLEGRDEADSAEDDLSHDIKESEVDLRIEEVLERRDWRQNYENWRKRLLHSYEDSETNREEDS